MAKTIILVFKKIFSWILGNITLVVFLSWGLFLNHQEVEYEPRVIFLGVGQGDAIFLIDSSGKKILIDGGGGDYVVYSIGEYLHPRDRVIDKLILTHPHEDHLSGLLDIMERYEVEEVLYFPACYSTNLYNYFLSLDENIKIIDPEYFYKGESFSLELLFPKYEISSGCVDFENVNNASIVTMLRSSSGNVLLTGDAEYQVENWLMRNYSKEELRTDVFKAGHHCSRTSNTRRFLEYIEPSYVVCCVGEDNRFGHPSAEVVQNLEELGIDYDLTYEVGNIVLGL